MHKIKKAKRIRLTFIITKPNGAEGDRTPDLMTASHALSHLSYSPELESLIAK